MQGKFFIKYKIGRSHNPYSFKVVYETILPLIYSWIISYLIKSYPTLIYAIRAELDMTDCDGKTALHLSCSEGHYDVVVQLLRAGANVNLVNLQVSACVSSNNFSCRIPAMSI